MRSGEAPSTAQVWQLLERVCDPEIPVVSLRELGVLRAVTALTTPVSADENAASSASSAASSAASSSAANAASNSATSAPTFNITITPTYSGCPAMGQMEADVIAALHEAGIHAQVTTVLAPAWTTDWMTDSARRKLREYGIAPPGPVHGSVQASGHSPAADTPSAKVIQFTGKRVANNPYGTCRKGSTGFNEFHPIVTCPRCASDNTTETSHFSSTACKALYKCLDCWEPFDYFKPL